MWRRHQVSIIPRFRASYGGSKEYLMVAEHVRTVAQELGYQPNTIAASMRTEVHALNPASLHGIVTSLPQSWTAIEAVLSPEGFVEFW
jgi:hypothetical protein